MTNSSDNRGIEAVNGGSSMPIPMPTAVAFATVIAGAAVGAGVVVLDGEGGCATEGLTSSMLGRITVGGDTVDEVSAPRMTNQSWPSKQSQA